MSHAWKRSAGVVAAFVVAACAIVAVAWRTVAAERTTVERDVRARLRASASEAAGTIAAAAAQLQARALVDPTAAIVRGGRFVEPPEPVRLVRLRDSEGRDPVGDKLLEEAQRSEVDPARVEAAKAMYEDAALEDVAGHDTDDARDSRDSRNARVTRDVAVRRLALFRLAALYRRMGRADEAARVSERFLETLDDETRTSVEGLFARIERVPRDEQLQRDLLLALGSGDDGVVLGMLRDSGLDDPEAIEARQEEIARIERLKQHRSSTEISSDFSGLDEGVGGALLMDANSLLAWAHVGNGEWRMLEGSRPELPYGARIAWAPQDLLVPRSMVEPIHGPDEIAESVPCPPLVGRLTVASINVATVELEAARRVRLVLGGLGLLLVGGAVLLYLTLRAVRRESEAAAARTAFVARVSHDLRTPLSVIRMYAETLAQGRATREEEVREFAGVAAREAERLTELVGRVLDFSRASMQVPAARSLVDLGDLLREVVDEHAQALAAAGMRLELVVSGEPLLVSGDREGLRAAVGNLLDNAIRHASSGGRIDVAASATPSESDEIEIRVSDRGPGLPIGLEKRIFEPFVRGPQARAGGSGLGLALVREVALAHRGRVEGANREAGGAVFTLELPRAEQAELANHAESAKQATRTERAS